MKNVVRVQMGVILPCRAPDLDPSRPRSKQRVCLYTKKTPRRLLGRHPNQASARRQEAAIEIRKHGR